MVEVSQVVTSKLRADGRRLMEIARQLDERSGPLEPRTASDVRRLRLGLEKHFLLLDGVLEAVTDDDI